MHVPDFHLIDYDSHIRRFKKCCFLFFWRDLTRLVEKQKNIQATTYPSSPINGWTNKKKEKKSFDVMVISRSSTIGYRKKPAQYDLRSHFGSLQLSLESARHTKQRRKEQVVENREPVQESHAVLPHVACLEDVGRLKKVRVFHSTPRARHCIMIHTVRHST